MHQPQPSAMNGNGHAETSPRERGSAGHTVQFYDREGHLHDAVAAFLAEGLRAGEAVVVVARQGNRDGFCTGLGSRGLDVDRAIREGRLALLDADEVLATFMVGGAPDEQLFRSRVGALIEERLDRHAGKRVRIFGEMVDVLWRAGSPQAAIRLEELWNDLARSHSFFLLCGYAMSNFREEGDARHFLEVCEQHAQVVPAESYTPGADDGTRLREITVLQQRARALETEIERRTELEEALREALAEADRANRVKSDFLAVMSHELRTPLNGIIGYQELLDQGIGGPVTREQRQYLGRIREGANQLTRLIDQILSLSRIQAAEVVPTTESVDAVGLAAEACALLEANAAGKGIRVELRAEQRPVPCLTDEDRTRQILVNLLSNAVKFSPEGVVELEVRAQGEWTTFDVRDQGEGIDPRDRERIFEPFVQLDTSATRLHGGAGLGLAVSRGLARLLGGDVTADRLPGTGNVFTLRLPRQAPRTGEARAPAA